MNPSISNLKVGLVMPTYFDEDSVLAGGERYAHELALALAAKTPTILFTFSKKSEVKRLGPLILRRCPVLFYASEGAMNPFSLAHLPALMNMDIIHCLQPRTWVTDFAMIAGFFAKKKVFLTDLSGGTLYTPGRFIPLHHTIKKFLPISEFNRASNPKIKRPHQIIYGGVNADFFCPSAQVKKQRDLILHAGRIFQGKGLHVLIEALPESLRLEVIGQCHDSGYQQKLNELGRGKRVRFLGAVSDEVLRDKYREALFTVLPSLIDTGFTSSMESMACGTPVLGTRLGSLPEVVKEGATGFLVSPNDPSALKQKLETISARPQSALDMAQSCRDEVLHRFTWAKVADRCMEAYAF